MNERLNYSKTVHWANIYLHLLSTMASLILGSFSNGKDAQILKPGSVFTITDEVKHFGNLKKQFV